MHIVNIKLSFAQLIMEAGKCMPVKHPGNKTTQLIK